MIRPRFLSLVAGSAAVLAVAVAVDWTWLIERYSNLNRPKPANADEVTTRVYDARDMIMSIPDFLSGSFSLSRRDPPFQRTRQKLVGISNWNADRRAQIEAILQSIRSDVAPDSWMETHGAHGRIRELGGQLIVTQTQQNQYRVARYLEFMRLQDRGWYWSQWLVIALLVTATTDVLLQWFHRARCRAQNECVYCGYDLRASSTRCPECGWLFEMKS